MTQSNVLSYSKPRDRRRRSSSTAMTRRRTLRRTTSPSRCRTLPTGAKLHARALRSFRQPAFEKVVTNSYCVFETCSFVFVSSELLTCRLLKWLLDHPMKHTHSKSDPKHTHTPTHTSESPRLHARMCKRKRRCELPPDPPLATGKPTPPTKSHA